MYLHNNEFFWFRLGRTSEGLYSAGKGWSQLRPFPNQTNATLREVIFVAPYFDAANFALYATGGVYRPSDGTIRAREDWYFSWIPKVFDALKDRQALNTGQYSLLGYSAGGQFSHRMLIMGDVDERLYWTVTGAPSTWTFTNATDVMYPYGLANADLEDARRRLPATFGRRHSVLVGEMDTVDTGVVNNNEEAAFQGRNRLERAAQFSIDAAFKSASLGGDYAWTFGTIPNAGHESGYSAIWESVVIHQGFPFYPQWRSNNWDLVVHEQL
jgi:hypothetical protein